MDDLLTFNGCCDSTVRDVRQANSARCEWRMHRYLHLDGLAVLRDSCLVWLSAMAAFASSVSSLARVTTRNHGINCIIFVCVFLSFGHLNGLETV